MAIGFWTLIPEISLNEWCKGPGGGGVRSVIWVYQLELVRGLETPPSALDEKILGQQCHDWIKAGCWLISVSWCPDKTPPIF